MRGALEGLNGVKKADVSFNKEEAVVYFEEGKTNVKEMIQAVNRAASLTKQLLAFGRRQIIAPKVLDLNIHVAEMEKMLRYGMQCPAMSSSIIGVIPVR